MATEREEAQTGLILFAALALLSVTAALFWLRSEEPDADDVGVGHVMGCYTAAGHPPVRITANRIQLIGHSPPRPWSGTPTGSPSAFTIPFRIEGAGEARSLVYDPANPSTIAASDFMGSQRYRQTGEGRPAGTLTITGASNGQSRSMLLRRAPYAACETD